MGKRIGLWQGVAAVFTVVNLVGLGMAMAAREQMHSGIHVLLSLVGAYAMWYLGARARRAASSRTEPDGGRLEQLQQSVDAIALYNKSGNKSLLEALKRKARFLGTLR